MLLCAGMPNPPEMQWEFILLSPLKELRHLRGRFLSNVLFIYIHLACQTSL